MAYLTEKRKRYDQTRQDRIKLLGFDEEQDRTETLVVHVEHIKESKEIWFLFILSIILHSFRFKAILTLY